jgi:signal transduction histidine kinase
VHTQPIIIDEKKYTLFTVQDISHEKRREALEKIFFHDVLNTATAIQGISEILNSTDEMDDVNEFRGLLLNSSQQLIREIQTQRDLLNAEQGILSINSERKSANEIISKAYNLYKETQLTNGKNFVCEYLGKDIYLKTDSVLLIRSLGNLIKNALEASQKSEHVKIYCNVEKDLVLFNVQNDGVIPEQIQLQLFQRSFSTKASNGRGIGTYSVKLLVEQYLKGTVSFISNNKVGTIFTLRIPYEIQSEI